LAHSGLISRFLNPSAKVLINAPEKNVLKKNCPEFEVLMFGYSLIQKTDFQSRKNEVKQHKPHNVRHSAGLIFGYHEEIVRPVGQEFYRHGQEIELHEKSRPVKPV
jgi:hypothetical protein